MKHLGFLLLFITFSANATQLPPVTNAEGSNYRFRRLVHLDATPVQDQGYTGTCWSFSGMSFFESELLRMGKDITNLSEMYVARKAYELKAEMYVRLDGKTNFGQGGEFHDIPAVIRAFGIVPEEVYTGLNYGAVEHNHSEMFNVLKGSVDGVIKHMNSRNFDGLSTAWKGAIKGILDAYFGEDIESFEYKGVEYTPKSYAKHLGLNMDEYLSVTSFTNHPMHKLCQLAIPDNWSRQGSWNVTLDQMFEVTVKALESGFTVGWTADVSEDGFDHGKGLAINPVDTDLLTAKEGNAFMNPVEEIKVTQEMRQEGYDNKTTQDDHLMHIVGLCEDQNGTKFFFVKNSWGTENYPEGFLYVSESYFKMKTIYVYLHQDGFSKDVKKAMGESKKK